MALYVCRTLKMHPISETHQNLEDTHQRDTLVQQY